MKIILNKYKAKKLLQNQKSIGFVPTMGGLHKGHLSLINKAKEQCKITVVSIFVNRQQFNNKNDYKSYPRNIKNDISMLKKAKVDFLYMPKENDIYKKKRLKKIKISPLGKKLCGKFRPGHFNAVVDVVDRFISIIKPNKIYFGEKDMQQLKIIQDFIYKNNINVNVIQCKTVREKNGIPHSSRNFNLTKEDRILASKVFNVVKNEKKNLIKKLTTVKKIKIFIKKLGIKKIDYIELININRLIRPFKKKRILKIFIAYYIKSTRLIDNI